jgi:N-carbamoyl-L-amino-acid hydrolase
MTQSLGINGQRLWDSLMTMAQIGALPAGGCCRLALSDEDKAGRDLFVEWCKAAGCTVTIDRMGNIFARRPGREAGRLPVVAGSHLDTQPHGGKFDGVYGVLAALEVVRSLNDHQVETTAPVEIVAWTNEEGARFAPSMLASGVFAGVFDLDYALARTDVAGKRFGDELDRIGYAGDQLCGEHPMAALFELHIEQGPILEDTATTIGVVSAVQGFRWYDVTVLGQDAHSGSTPMVGRRDALLGSARIIEAVNQIALDHAPDGRGTVGHVRVTPNSRNTIPGRVDFTVDFRHPSADVLLETDAKLRAECARLAGEIGLDIAVQEDSYSPPVSFNQDCVAAVQGAAEKLGYSYRRMISGAGHDACYISTVAPTSMIFIPCAGGISHNEAESAEPEHTTAGANVLLHAVLDVAG